MKKASRIIIISMVILMMLGLISTSASAEELNVGIPVEDYPELFINRTMPTHGEGKITVFLIQFPDALNDNPDATAEYYNKLYFSEGMFDSTIIGDRWNYSVSTLYSQQSYGKLKLSGQVFDWYTAKHERSYYDAPSRKAELVMEAVQYYESKGVNFDHLDGDNNGELDAVIYHFAGDVDSMQEEPWYGGFEVSAHVGETKNGKQINSFIQISNNVEASSRSRTLLRTICHELMHTMGMFDLYGNAWFNLIPVDDLMSNNQVMINPYYKLLLGWTDKVTLVTSDSLDIKINEWYKTGETLLVTDKFNGIFDEFYMIACSKENEYAEHEVRIWHVDARLNEDKTKFLNNNLSYSPKPDIENPHADNTVLSKYLFMEEVSSIPAYDMVLNLSQDIYFKEGSVLGPNSIPSTDTHDGRHTGIKINDIKRYDGYATMDIIFNNKDTTSPQVSDALSVLGFGRENKLRFCEYVYPSDNWEKIQITTPTGEVIPAQITRGYYSRHELEIVFEEKVPDSGYIITLPEGCVVDSSGNKNKKIVVPVLPEGRVFEESSTFLPWYYEGRERFWEGEVFHFTYGDENIIITGTGEGSNKSSIMEFLKIDANGNILTHKFILNPYPELFWSNIIQTSNGRYIIPLYGIKDRSVDYVMCIDNNGDLVWHKKSDYTLSGAATAYNEYAVFFDTGSRNLKKAVYINSNDGSITAKDTNQWAPNFGDVCYDGTNFIGIDWSLTYKKLSLYVRDPNNLAVKREYRLDNGEFSNCSGKDIVYNGNGTYTVVVTVQSIQTGKREIVAYKIDSSFKVTKRVVLKASPLDGNFSDPTFFPNDGFAIPVCVTPGNHANTSYHVIRMDKNLNFMWETSVEATRVLYFVTKSNEIAAFVSYLSPKREAYLIKYGTEDNFELISHTMVHHGASAATCAWEGRIEHWICSECGGCFLDADGKNEVTYASVIIPKTAHNSVPYADKQATCTESGSTGGTYCSVCKAELTAKTVVPAVGHTEVKENDKPATCVDNGYIGRVYCSVCNEELEEEVVIPATGHTEVKEDDVAATCTENGYLGRTYCSVCDTELIPAEVVPATGHTVVIDAAVAPTYESDGLTEGSHCSVCNEILTAQEVVDRLVTEPDESEETIKPDESDEKDSYVGVSSVIIAVAVAAIAFVGVVVEIIILLRKRK